MKRFVLIMLILLAPSFAAHAIEAPAGQIIIDNTKVLRGSFVEEHQMNSTQNPVLSSGHFVVAPGHGLIWAIDKPFPTATIVTPNGAIQDFGGVTIKLPVKNLRHLYTMIGGALAGDWNGLDIDFIITRSGDNKNWQMLMTPRPGDKPKLPYATITVSGSHFVQNIVMTKTDGSSDTLSFADAVLSSTPLNDKESALFKISEQ